MDHRLFFVIGDILANIVTGVLAALVSWLVIGTGWNMMVAMIIAMLLGMVVSLPVFFIAAIRLGAMEVMVPTMFTGMLAGMVVGMAAAMMPLALPKALLMGGGTALVGLMLIWLLNARLRGVQRL